MRAPRMSLVRKAEGRGEAPFCVLLRRGSPPVMSLPSVARGRVFSEKSFLICPWVQPGCPRRKHSASPRGRAQVTSANADIGFPGQLFRIRAVLSCSAPDGEFEDPDSSP